MEQQQIGQQEVDIFFGCISGFIKSIAGMAQQAGLRLDYLQLMLGRSNGRSGELCQPFRVAVDRIVYNRIDDPKFMVSLPFEVENESEKKKT